MHVELAAGQASLHHGWVVHSSHPNTSDDRRIGLVLNYIKPGVRQIITTEETATLVRGVDLFGHFKPEPLCEDDFTPDSLAFQAEIERLKHQVYDQA